MAAQPETFGDKLRQALYGVDNAAPGLRSIAEALNPARPLNQLRVAKGMSLDALWEVGKSLWGQGSTIAKEILRDPTLVSNPGLAAQLNPQGQWNIINAAGMGLPQHVADRYHRYIDEIAKSKADPLTPQDYAWAMTKATGATAGMDVLPGQEIANLLSGQTAEGAPLTPEEIGKNITLGVLKAGTLKTLQGKGRALRRVTEDPGVAQVRTTGELKAASEAIAKEQEAARARDVTPEQAAAVQQTLAPARPPTVDPALIEHVQYVEKGAFDNPYTAALTAETASSSIFRQLVTDPEFIKLPQAERLAEAVRQGALAPETVVGFSRRYNVPLEQSVSLAAEVLKRTASKAGEKLVRFQEGLDVVNESLYAAAKAGDPAALAQLRSMRQAAAAAKRSQFPAAINAAKGFERASLTTMLAHPKTAIRNFQAVSGFGVATKIVGDIVAGATELFVDRFATREGRPLRSHFADLLADGFAAWDAMPTKARKVYREFLDTVPAVERELSSASAFDLSANVLRDTTQWLTSKGKEGLPPRNLAEYGLLFGDVLKWPNHAQEVFLRKIMFDARLRGSLERLGIPDYEAAIRESAKPIPAENFRLAVADAKAYALKQTFSAQPTGMIAKAVINTYDKIPLLTFVLPPFPRFMANQISFIMDHAPTSWLELFTPKFREVLTNGAKDGFASRQAARVLGEGFAGMMMLSGAYQFRTSDIAGPKYYQVNTGTDQATREKRLLDLRPYQPFTGFYSFFADIIKCLQNGTSPTPANMNLTTDEWLEGMTSLRKFGDVPMFTLAEAIQTADSSNPDAIWRAVNTPIGKAFSRFFMPAKAMQDVLAMGGYEESATVRSIRGQEALGPSMAMVPGFSYGMPARIDPATGQPMKQRDIPIAFAGFAVDYQSKLDSIVSNTPGLGWGEVIGSNGSEQADAYVATYVGKIFNTRLGGSTIGDTLADIYNTMDGTTEFKVWQFKQFLTKLRSEAIVAGTKEIPHAFAHVSAASQSMPAGAKTVIEQELIEQLRQRATSSQ